MTLPAVLITKRYPSPKEKISSGDTLESEHVIIKTGGFWPLTSSFKLLFNYLFFLAKSTKYLLPLMSNSFSFITIFIIK